LARGRNCGGRIGAGLHGGAGFLAEEGVQCDGPEAELAGGAQELPPGFVLERSEGGIHGGGLLINERGGFTQRHKGTKVE